MYPTAWKRPRQRHADIRDDYVDLLRQALADFERAVGEHGQGYARGQWDGIWLAMRLTLSEEEGQALIERARAGMGTEQAVTAAVAVDGDDR